MTPGWNKRTSNRELLFHYPIFNVGGAEFSTIRLLRSLVQRDWKVTLVLTTGGGLAEKMLDSRIKVVRLRPSAFGRKFKQAKTLLEKVSATPDLLGYGLSLLVGYLRMFPFLFKRYELAACLLHGMSTGFIRRAVTATVRMVWIRNDLGSADSSGETRIQIERDCGRIDYYICVSKVAMRSLVQTVPAVASKARVIHNVIDADEMWSKAQLSRAPFPPRRHGVPRILTVCRLSEAPKGLIRMAQVCKRLVDLDYQFEWFVIGDGPDREVLSSNITDLGISSFMTLLGRLDNPFPAYRDCDVVAVLSNYEGLCGVVNEAKVMQKAVIATRFSGIEEQIVNGESGLIVGNNEQSIVDGLASLLKDPDLVLRLAKSPLQPAVLDDSEKVESIERLIQGQEKNDRD